MSNLLLMQYNNYYNRTIKKEVAYQSYIEHSTNNSIITNINFIPADGINTNQIINWNENWVPDYLVVLNDDYTINSRWFVINSDQTRGLQYRLGLHRDIVADNLDSIVNSPMFVEKGYLTNLNDPAVFNKENLTFNQIKTKETLLKDDVGCAWLVGWFNANMSNADIKANFENISVGYGKQKADIEVSSLSDLEYYNDITQGFSAPTDDTTLSIPARFVYYNGYKSAYATLRYSFNGGQWFYPNDYTEVYRDYKVTFYLTNNVVTLDKVKEIVNFFFGIDSEGSVDYEDYGLMGYLQNEITNQTIINQFSLKDKNLNDYIVNKYNGKSIYVASSGKYYRLNFSSNTSADKTEVINSSSSIGMKIIDANTTSNTLYYVQRGEIQGIGVNLTLNNLESYSYSFEEISKPQGSLTANVNNIYPNTSALNEQPFCAFAIPYKESDYYIYHDGASTSMNKYKAFAAASLLQIGLGDNCYDLQLLPYNPFGAEVYSNGSTINFSQITSPNRVINFYESGNVSCKAFLFFNSTFSTNINIENISMPDNVLDVKVVNETKSYRLCSPQYTDIYEVNPMMNYGVSGWKVDCTYKPYQSYVHVAPIFKGLFGNFQDQRGLIVKGSFSVPQISDSWINYINNNKNYSQIFERGIENMEINQTWQRANAISSAITGTVSGAIAGGTSGALIGGPLGILGGAIGGISAAAGGVADVVQTIALQKETIDYTKDLYQFNLGNIQAQPDTLKSVSSFDANTRLYPFVEVFECTDIERKALIDKITFNGMTIGRIGTINEFTDFNGRYIKGQLIRLENTNNDFHELAVIAEELYKGVFI